MKLTDEQIAELAPEWATHYDVSHEFNGILFESHDFFTWFFYGDVGFVDRENQLQYGINKDSKPIPRKPKPFDIAQHEWSDVIAEIEPESGHTLVINSHGSWLSFDKEDAIAMAKDRGVTAEDLK